MQTTRLIALGAPHRDASRAQVLDSLVPGVSDFIADAYGRVIFDGIGTWTAADGGAAYTLSRLTPSEAVHIDTKARRFAHPDE